MHIFKRQKLSNQNNKISEMDKLTKSFRFQNRELLDNYVILATTDKNGVIKHVSTNLCKIFLYKSSELLDKPYSFLISKDSIKTFKYSLMMQKIINQSGKVK